MESVSFRPLGGGDSGEQISIAPTSRKTYGLACLRQSSLRMSETFPLVAVIAGALLGNDSAGRIVRFLADP